MEKEEEERVKREGLAQQTETEKREDLYSVEGRENMFRERWKKWLKW